MIQHPLLPKARGWLAPLVYLSNNWLSFIGVLLVTTSTVFWLFLLPTSFYGESQHPYLGILAYLILPVGFFAGLAVIPLGIFLRFRRERRQGKFPERLPPLDLHNVQLRRLLIFVGVATFANILIGSQFTYEAVSYMDSVTFCGQTCHTVMQPEYAAYQNSPHSRVECVACHIGPGASWFVRSKLSGVGQVFAVTFDTYPRPIPVPVENLRPARETCEACHWPQKFGGDRLRIVPKYADDEANTRTSTVLLMRIGGGEGTPGIHGVHLGPGVVIRYAHSDEKRQKIPWVEFSKPGSQPVTFLEPGTKPEEVRNLPVRVMDCMDCHNRPTHTFTLPERALDQALAAGEISPSLPFVKKKSLELLKMQYASRAEAERTIPAELEKYYRESYPAVYREHRAWVTTAAESILGIYDRNVFPTMKVTWGTYPNNIGHTDFPGCFRCHDDLHAGSSGKTIPQDCSGCHQLLAMEEARPPILNQLGIPPTTISQ